MAKTFTIQEIRNYIQSQDSLGDVLYNLSETNIEKANKPTVFDFDNEEDYLDYAESEY